MPDANHALVVQNLVKMFGGMTAIDDVSLEVATGEVVSLLGPSGCGKTTTLRCIAGFYQPDGGTISVGGRLLASRDKFVPPEGRQLAMVFQNYVLWPHMTAYENIAYGLRLRGVSKSEIRRRIGVVVDALSLTGLEDRYPHALSGGQQQRVSVARSLVVEPDVLLLDEPFSNLDAELRISMRQEMRLLLKQFGTTGIYVTHDQEEAMVLSDRIFLMSRGAIVQAGRPIDLFEQPNSRFTAQFFGISNFVEALFTPDAEGPAARLNALGALVRLRGDSTAHAAGEPVLIGIRDDGMELSPSRPQSPSAFEVRIDTRLYLGGEVQLGLVCADGARLSVRCTGSDALAWPDNVWVSIKPGAVLLPAAERQS